MRTIGALPTLGIRSRLRTEGLTSTREVRNTQPPELRFRATLGQEPKVVLAFVDY
jgi:hypothetical protein